MSFDTTARIAAFPPATLAGLADLVAAYGEELPTVPLDPHSPKVRTLLGWTDRAGSTDLRAARIGIDAHPITLTDGRIAIQGHWTTAIKTAWEQGEITADELTAAEMQSLMPEGEE